MKFFKVLLFISLLCSFGYAGSIVIEKLLSQIKKYEKENAPEKTFIHTDKPYYTTGETIWLKSYLVNGVNHSAIKKSEVLYVELINSNDSIVFKEKQHVSKSDLGVAGSILINEKWDSGNYQLRAYTNYMRNDNSNYFFKKNIAIEKLKEPVKGLDYIDLNNVPVIDTTKVKEDINNTIVSKLEDLTIKFYPEGGTIVANKKNVFGIKALHKNGNGVKIEGVIREKQTKTISSPFRTFDFGLGSVSFIPKINVK